MMFFSRYISSSSFSLSRPHPSSLFGRNRPLGFSAPSFHIWSFEAGNKNQQRSFYVENSGRVGNDLAFVIKHKVNSMDASTLKPKEVCYVDSDTSNHMTNYEEWFSSLEKPAQVGYVETGDDTTHPSNISAMFL